MLEFSEAANCEITYFAKPLQKLPAERKVLPTRSKYFIHSDTL